MADPFLGEIRMVGFNFAPAGWAECNGQILPLSQNTALFSLLGTQYGGNGQTTFALPNLQGSVAIAQGQGPGLSPRFIGEQSGEATVTLLSTQIASHTHSLNGAGAGGSFAEPNGHLWATPGASRGLTAYAPSAGSSPQMSPGAIASVGGQPHNNLMPYLVIKFVIALQGIYPPRS
jgi:microcystin-dependent protein